MTPTASDRSQSAALTRAVAERSAYVLVDSRRGVRRRLVAALLCPPAGEHSAGRGLYAVDNGGVADGVRPLRCGGSVAKLLVTLCYLPSRVFFAREHFTIW